MTEKSKAKYCGEIQHLRGKLCRFATAAVLCIGCLGVDGCSKKMIDETMPALAEGPSAQETELMTK